MKDIGPGDGATPLGPEELEGLLLTHITTRRELDRWEQDNIAEGEVWAFGRKHKVILSEGFVRRLHKRMFDNVWRWAGEFRKSDKNIGVPWREVPIQLREVLEDVKVWIDSDTCSADEMATRFHHRLVFIHPFPNGNGRHARTMTDLLLEQVLHSPRFTWGRDNLIDPGGCRRLYIEALQSADEHEYGPLIKFMRS